MLCTKQFLCVGRKKHGETPNVDVVSDKFIVLEICIGGNHTQQDRQRACNITLWRVRVMFIPLWLS